MNSGPSARKALVVLSGGQDSTTCLYWAITRYDEVYAVTYNYGQRHDREVGCAQSIATLAGIKEHEIVNIGPILQGKSPLTNPDEKLETYDNFDSMTKIIGDRVELTFVPMRNALFLTLAANHAAVRGIFDIVTGVCQADGANYPDCREDFIVSMNRAIIQALDDGAYAIHTPLINLKKHQSVDVALRIPGCYAALGFSHTAYDGDYPPVGKDHASVLRARGFEEAGVPDPLVLRAWRSGLMALPETANYANIEMPDPAMDTLTWLAEVGEAYRKQKGLPPYAG